MREREREREKKRERERWVRFYVSLSFNLVSFSFYFFRILCSLVSLSFYEDSLYEEAMKALYFLKKIYSC